MQFDLATLKKLLEDRPDWLVATAGVLVAVLGFALFRGLVWFWRSFSGAPRKNQGKSAIHWADLSSTWPGDRMNMDCAEEHTGP